jgi:murein L,D-transpeptidase YcbB/YkuD
MPFSRFLRLLPLVSAAVLTAALAACDNGGGGQSARPPQSSQPARAGNPAAADGPLRPDQVQAAVQTLQAAPLQGFAPGAFGDVQQIASRAASGDAAEQARGQAQLRRAIVAYARAQHGLGLPTDQFPKEWGIRPASYDARAELRAALAHDGLSDWLKALPPPSPRYAALVQALAAYRKLAAEGGWKTVSQGPRCGRAPEGTG